MSGDRIKLEVKERSELGSRSSRRLRAEGLIPGVLYGNGHSRAIAVPERDLRSAMSGPSGLHAILDVVVEGADGSHPSILADYQQDPLRGTLAHIDLREVRLDQAIQATVTIQLVGEALGVKSGGVLSLVTREIQVEALPTEIPEHIDVDVSAMDVGDVLRLEDVPRIEGVAYLDDPHETVIANVTMPRGFAELEEADALAAAEAAELEEGEVEEGEAPAAEEGAEAEAAPVPSDEE